MTTEVHIVSPLSSLRDAMKMMRDKKVKSLVVDRKNEHDAYGIITYTTILKEIIADDGDIDLLNVYDVSTKPALYISKELDVKYVAKLMTNQNIKRLLVFSNNRLEGIISMSDILKAVIEEMGI